MRFVELINSSASFLRLDRQLQANSEKWKYCWLFEVGAMRNSHLKTVRKLWKECATLPNVFYTSFFFLIFILFQFGADVLWTRGSHGKGVRNDRC